MSAGFKTARTLEIDGKGLGAGFASMRVGGRDLGDPGGHVAGEWLDGR